MRSGSASSVFAGRMHNLLPGSAAADATLMSHLISQNMWCVCVCVCVCERRPQK
jgi:hypothetical protein